MPITTRRWLWVLAGSLAVACSLNPQPDLPVSDGNNSGSNAGSGVVNPSGGSGLNLGGATSTAGTASGGKSAQGGSPASAAGASAGGDASGGDAEGGEAGGGAGGDGGEAGQDAGGAGSHS